MKRLGFRLPRLDRVRPARVPLSFCPLTATAAQGTRDDDGDGEPSVRLYKPIEWLACGRIHLINPITGKLMSEEAEG